MVKAYLGLGSNIGNRELQLNEAIKILHDYQGIQVTQVSHIYETEPVGYTNQPKFLNLCIEIETELNPQSLLKCCLTTEQQLHRKREIRWGPRTLEIGSICLVAISFNGIRTNERSFILGCDTDKLSCSII